MKFSFKNDYSEGCHPNILQVLTATNMHQKAGYGEDDFCREAGRMIREKFSTPDAAVHFVLAAHRRILL